MKATKLFAILAMALLMVAMPSQAQSRKERKAAEKAAWEARQQFIKDSTEIANKQRLDEMKKAPQEEAEKAAAEEKARKEAAAKADDERRQREERQKAEEKAKQKEAQEQWQDVNIKCPNYKSTAELIRGRGFGESKDIALSKDYAEEDARNLLERQLGSVFENILRNDENSWNQDKSEKISKALKDATKVYTLNLNALFIVSCDEYQVRKINGEEQYRTTMVVEISKEDAKRVAFNDIKQLEKDLEIEKGYDWEKFDEDFDKEYEKYMQRNK